MQLNLFSLSKYPSTGTGLAGRVMLMDPESKVSGMVYNISQSTKGEL